MAATVASIFIYPIKSCRGISVSQAPLTPTGKIRLLHLPHIENSQFICTTGSSCVCGMFGYASVLWISFFVGQQQDRLCLILELETSLFNLQILGLVCPPRDFFFSTLACHLDVGKIERTAVLLSYILFYFSFLLTCSVLKFPAFVSCECGKKETRKSKGEGICRLH